MNVRFREVAVLLALTLAAVVGSTHARPGSHAPASAAMQASHR